MTEEHLVRCPNCNTDNLARQLGGGAGLIFKGSGFYLTDYKKESKKPESTKDQPKEKSSDKKESSTPPPSPEAKPSNTKPTSDGSTSSKKE